MATALQTYMDANPRLGPVESAVEVLKTAIAAMELTVDNLTLTVGNIAIKDADSSDLAPVSPTTGVYVDVRASALPTGASSAANQSTANTSLSTIAAKDFSTQTTLAAVLAKIIAAPATEVTSAAILAKIIAAPATASAQATEITALQAIQAAVEASLPTRGVRGTFTDRSGTIAAASTSQQVAASNATRNYLFFQNNSTATMWINFGTSAVANQPSIKIISNGEYILEGNFINTAALNVICASDTSVYTCKEA